MRHKLAVPVILAVGLGLSAAAGASTNTKPSSQSVHVQQPLNIAHNVVIGFRPRVGLPRGGYYYAVLVLVDYVLYNPPAPQCAISSDMEKTQYAYPARARPVRLALKAAKSTAGQ
jgi:hypothetical protein